VNWKYIVTFIVGLITGSTLDFKVNLKPNIAVMLDSDGNAIKSRKADYRPDDNTGNGDAPPRL
jgi:hypothetical protein